jgi:peptidoglycan/LPS O-acetylase OafA/YrhL
MIRSTCRVEAAWTRPVAPLGRLPDLDLLRALAVFLVLGRHVLLIPEDLPDAALVFWRLWNRSGWIGVDLFFTLSGFLVSGILFREFLESGQVSPGRFLIRRGLKIYPAFYTFLILSLIPSLTTGLYSRPEVHTLMLAYPPPSFNRIMGEVFFVQNYGWYLWGHTWSLAVEEHFYIGLAVLVALSVRYRRDPQNAFSFIPPLVVGVGLLLLVVRITLGYGLGGRWWQILPRSHLRIDSLLYGVLLSYYYNTRHTQTVAFFRRYRWWLGLASAVMIAPALKVPLEENPFMYTVGFTFLYLAFGNVIMLMRVWDSRVRDVLMEHLRWFVVLGRHSYSIYLWHLSVYIWAITLLRSLTGGSYFVVEVIVYMVGAVVVGTGMSMLVEQPVLRLRDKVFPSRSVR